MVATTLADRYRRWFEYEKDSHQKVLASLEAVPAAKREAPEFRKALSWLAHLMAARQLWLFRFGVGKAGPTDFFPERVSMAEVAAQVEEVHQAWTEYLAQLDEAELARVFEYQSQEGAWFRNSVEDTLTQLCGHSWYHRGQIAALIRSIGEAPVATDFVFWAREPVPPREAR
jgi:uncharacterized damage-inducible protein DinB